MKDIGNGCYRDEVATVDEICQLSPPCPPNPHYMNWGHASYLSPDTANQHDPQFCAYSYGVCQNGFPLTSMNSGWQPNPLYPPPLFRVADSPADYTPAPASNLMSLSSSTYTPTQSLSTLPRVSSPAISYSPSSYSVPAVTSPSVGFIPSPSLSKPVTPDPSSQSPPLVLKVEAVSPAPLPEPQEQCEQPPLPSAAPSQVSRGPLKPISTSRPVSPGRTVSGSLLPPCKICLDKASGFHYGLNTCEACKGFFRRSLKRGASYTCARSGNCDVTGGKRNMCSYCRYQKCISQGMSTKAIKTGRYTHAKRTKDTLEIKRLMGRESPRELHEEDFDFEAIIAQVTKAHDEFVISSTKVPNNIIMEKQQKRVEEVKLNVKHFGNMMGVSADEHQEIFNMTGLDVDNRRELMKFHVKNSERWIRGYISFAKKLPGFRELTLNDQANLVKYARIEFWFLGSFPGYNADLGVAMMPNGRCFTRREMYSVWKNKYIDVSFDLSQKLQKLQVTPEEMIIVKAICLTAGDRCQFEDRKRVDKIQWSMISCLQYLLQKRCTTHKQFVSIFSKVFSCLTDLRDLNEAEYQTIQNTQLYQLFTENPLIMEMLPY